MEAVEDYVGGNNHALAHAIAAEHPGVCACVAIYANSILLARLCAWNMGQ